MICLPSTTQATKFSEHRMFLLIFIVTIQQIFCLSPLLLMCIWCQFLPSWIPFEHSNFSLRLQPRSPITRLKWPPIPELWLHHLVVSGAGSVMVVVHVLLIDGFSPTTNWKYPHSKNMSWNNFRGPSGHALFLPSHVFLLCVRSFFHPLIPSACYAGYYNVRVAHKLITTLQWPLTNVKDKDKPEDSQGAVHKIKC